MSKVYIVGAGPGHKDLITVRGRELIGMADAILYDSLIDNSLLDNARDDCLLINVGKRMGSHSMKQEEINGLLIRTAKSYRTVVRLKGGDPFVFGRGGEEAMALIGEGIDFELIPGVSSAIAVPEHAGIPVTHRGIARSFHVITGQTMDDETDFGRYAGLDGTLVFLMGLSNLYRITGDLLKAGMDPETPAAVISCGYSEDEYTVQGTLSDITRASDIAEIKTPSVIVIGETAGYRLKSQTFEFFRKRRFLTVGTDRFYEHFSSEMARLGLRTSHWLRIQTEIIPEGRINLERALNSIEEFEWLIFASGNAVRLFFEIADEIRFDRRRLGRIRFAVIGEATQAALNEYGYYADIVPGVYTGKALAERLVKEKQAGPALIIRAESGSDEMFDVLDGSHWDYEKVILYRAVINKEKIREAPRRDDHIVLASASGVRAFLETRDIDEDSAPRFACIGSSTAEELRKYGYEADIIAETHTARGLAEKLSEAVGCHP